MQYPTMTGLFSLSSSSKDVGGATRGSGVQSSTSSSISYSTMSTCAVSHGPPIVQNIPHR
jgi:hypothetical protein